MLVLDNNWYRCDPKSLCSHHSFPSKYNEEFLTFIKTTLNLVAVPIGGHKYQPINCVSMWYVEQKVHIVDLMDVNLFYLIVLSESDMQYFTHLLDVLYLIQLFFSRH